MRAERALPPRAARRDAGGTLLRALAVIGGALLFAGVARGAAGTDTAERHYERGMKAYDLGRFDEAISEFERAYELSSDPVLLFNLAQAQRRAGALERALFFYRRFVALAPTSPVREKAELRIAELERALAETAAPTAEPPTPTPPALPSQASSEQKPTPGETAEPVEPEPATRNTRLSLAAGAASTAFGGSVPEASLAPVLRLELHRDLGAAELRAFVGAGASAATFDYETVADRNRAWLLGALVHAGARQALDGGLSLSARGSAGLLWWDLPDGSEFTPAGTRTTGALPLFSLRAALSGGYALTRRTSLTLEIGFTYAHPLDERLAQTTESVRQGDVLAGVETVF